MLHPLGKQARVSGDLIDALAECHERIRRFTALAGSIAVRTDAPSAEIVEACAGVERYFREALPLHVRDEEEGILPRLRGRSAELDAALTAMHDQHGEHEPGLRALLAALASVRERPDDGTRRAALGVIAGELDRAFAEHMANEEAVIFPALGAHLSDGERAAVRAEMIARRAR